MYDYQNQTKGDAKNRRLLDRGKLLPYLSEYGVSCNRYSSANNEEGKGEGQHRTYGKFVPDSCFIVEVVEHVLPRQDAKVKADEEGAGEHKW